MPKLSAYVITYNEQAKIRDALESIKWVDEIVVVDSFSTDETVRICRDYTDKIYQRKFEGFGKLRNDALDVATHDWILSLDADERVTNELRTEIQHELSGQPRADAFFIPRINYFLGRQIRHSGWYPDYRQPQVFHKARMRYTDDPVHHTYTLNGTAAYLKGHIIQYPFLNLDQYLQKMDRYSTLMVDQMVQHGKKFHHHQLISHPIFTFFKMYIFRLGFMDGYQGLILAGLYTYYTFIKYAKFWEYSQTLQEGPKTKEMEMPKHGRERV